MARDQFLKSTVSKGVSSYFNRSENSIAGGALTNSKRVESHVKGVYPTHLRRAQGEYVYDEHGNRYLDYICGLGSSVLGHSPGPVAKAIEDNVRQGISLSLSSTIEVECAELLQTYFPMLERLRFLKTGSDACAAAIRFARAFNGRSEVLSEGYHGWADGFVSMTPPHAGVTDSYDYKKLEQVTYNTAAVIVEPVMTDWSPKRIEFLKDLRAKCTKFGAVLIFDEVITGMRVPA